MMKKHEMDKEEKSFIQSATRRVPALGIILGLSSGLFFGLTVVLAKYVSYINPFIQLFVRGCIHYSIFLSVVIYQKEPIFPRVHWKTATSLMACVSFAGLIPIFIYTALQYIPVADNTAIMFTTPALVAILSVVFLGDACKVMHVIVVILSTAGTVVISKPSVIFGGDTSTLTTFIIPGVFLSLAGTVSCAIFMLAAGKLANFPYSTLNLYTGMVLLIFASIGMLSIEKIHIPICTTDGLIVITSSVLAVGGVLLTVIACQIEHPRNVSVSQTIQMPFVIILQVIILGIIPEWNSYVGTLLIIISVLLTWGMKWWELRRKQIDPFHMTIANDEPLCDGSEL